MPHICNVGGVRPVPFLYVPAISNAVTTGNGMDTKYVLNGLRAYYFQVCWTSSLANTVLIEHMTIYKYSIHF